MNTYDAVTKKTWHIPQTKKLKPHHTLSGSTAALDESSKFISGDCVGRPVN
ncbi:MAG: hypothetical protein P1U34_00650 [Coxiellaceae bacterium]|nr:hypothetical protein [Coxiellaceae bacterium]